MKIVIRKQKLLPVLCICRLILLPFFATVAFLGSWCNKELKGCKNRSNCYGAEILMLSRLASNYLKLVLIRNRNNIFAVFR
jgi:hypothetical protein